MLEVDIRAKAFRSTRGAPRQVLRDIAFSATPGEVIVLLGPSGIGKSTVFRIILGLDTDFEGSASLAPARLGIVFQEPRLLPWLSVEENLRLVLPPGAPAPDIATLLADVLLPPLRTSLPSALSLGMARRVAIARALVVDPEILVLDEPFASLDQALASALGMSISERARRRGTLALLSTHDVGQAVATATRILVIAGEPATLAADITLPAYDDPAARSKLRQDLLTRFAFLGETRGGCSSTPQANTN